LAYSLSTYFSCYGVDSYNLYNNNKIAKLHDLAQYYLKDIKKIMQNTYQVNYHLLGWSLGGLIALEVASILEKCNHKKINVYLLDTTLYSHLLPTKGKNLEKLKDYYKEYLLSKKYDKLYIDRVLSNIEIEEELMVQSISSVLKHTKVLLFKAMLRDFNFNISLNNISPQISSYNNIDKLLENLSNLTVVKVEHAYHNNILTQKKIIASHILEYNSIKAGYLI
jgi:thioesterase domain-containing protein